VLVRESRVVAVIDPAPLRGDPAYDLSYWSFFGEGSAAPPTQILDGYRSVTPLPADLELRLYAYTLAHSARLITYFAREGRERWAQHCLRRFTESLGWLRSHT
jgi:fructosamine-3-kinase